MESALDLEVNCVFDILTTFTLLGKTSNYGVFKRENTVSRLLFLAKSPLLRRHRVKKYGERKRARGHQI